MRIDHQLHGLADQLEGDLVALPLVRHRAVLIDQPVVAMQEELVELGGEDAQGANPDQTLTVALKRSDVVEARVRDLVVALLQPGPEPGVESMMSRTLSMTSSFRKPWRRVRCQRSSVPFDSGV